MKKALIIFSVIALSACTSAGDLRNRSAYGEFTSDKSPLELAECINLTWQEIKFGGSPNLVQMHTSGDVYSISVGHGAKFEVADVKEWNNGSMVIMYAGGGTFGYRKERFQNGIKNCL